MPPAARPAHPEPLLRRSRRRSAIGLTLAVAALAVPATALGFVNLPASGSQVDSDTAAGIDPGKDAGVVDAVAGSLVAGGPAVPWAIFEHGTSGEQQIFVRAFKNGAWVTQGTGTVNGASSAVQRFSGSLNFAQDNEAEAPSIDFAGAGRTVPWATWYEDHIQPFGTAAILASRFDAATAKWVFAGQGRTATGGPPILNVDVTKNAVDPAVAGGTTVAGGNPGPWITWQEEGPTKEQIFVEKPIGPGTTACPPGTKPAGGAPVGGFCWQQVGIERAPLGAPTTPSLNVDPTRDGIEPDIAFTGPGDTVPWVVWYETGRGTFGVHNERVFAAKAVADGGADGGFHWAAVGRATGAPQALDTSAGGAGACLASKSTENLCTLNRKPNAEAEDPKIAAGTMAAGQPTVPWITWDEQVRGISRIFVARLAAGGTHFEVVNGGRPISAGRTNAVKADITFAGHTPFVTWHQRIGRTVKVVVAHLRNAAHPVAVLDTRTGISHSRAGVTLATPSPISSACTANPFNADGTTCQGGASKTPFFLFNDGRPGGRHLFAKGL